MSFWRDELIDYALDQETRLQMEEQRAWIAREPDNPQPYFHLAQFYRMSGKRDAALGLLLESVRLDEDFADAHLSLAEMYAVAEDYAAAWRHARAAERNGKRQAVEMLLRHGVSENE
jgi:thioredoxin-like negative regulator of GroEL